MTLTKWYEKTVYVIGWIAIVLFLLGFVFGFVSSAVQNGQNNSQTLNYTNATNSGGLTQN